MQHGPSMPIRPEFQVERAPLTERSSESCNVKQDGLNSNGPLLERGAVSNFAPTPPSHLTSTVAAISGNGSGGSQLQIRVSRP
jgi:hypothetical protein